MPSGFDGRVYCLDCHFDANEEVILCKKHALVEEAFDVLEGLIDANPTCVQFLVQEARGIVRRAKDA